MTTISTTRPTTAAATGFVETSLAATLRVWRDRVPPAAVGLPAGRAHRGSRRAAGLRREELADLAGVSVDYLVRLEQGRATAPSGQVVAALARVLQLTPAERDHLYRLAGLQPPGDRVIRDDIPPGVRRLLTRLGEVAVAVFAADWQMVWWNRGWAALLGDPSDVAPEERSLVRARFPTPGGRGRVEFAQLWRAGAVAAHAEDRKTIAHPAVGEITVDCDVLSAGDTDLKIVALTAPPGSDDADRIARACTTALTHAP